MRLLAAVSLLLLIGTAGHTEGPQRTNSPKRANELTLAGMRPGRDSVARAAVKHTQFVKGGNGDPEYRWEDYCHNESLTVTVRDGKVSEVRVSEFIPPMIVDCIDRLPPSRWRTGRDLGFWDSAARVVQLYGGPDSRSPSTKDGQRLELLYYAFDWAGPDVPQVMEVLCTVEKDGMPGRVVEITLAASSL